MNEEETSVSAGTVASKIMAWKAKKIFGLIVAGIVLGLLLILFIIVGIFALGDDEEEESEDTCTATHITITGEVSGSNVELRLMSENGMDVPNIKGTIKNNKFTASKKMSSKEASMLNGTNAQKAWSYFRKKGYTEEATAGILGNLEWESPGIDPKKYQGGGGPGRGIAQWSVNERWVTLKKYASKRGLDPWALETQLEFVDYEIFNGQIKKPSEFKALKSIDKATEIFCKQFERPGDVRMAERKKNANNFYKQFKGTMAIGDITLEGTIKKNNVSITGFAGEEPIKATGSVSGNKFSANGYMGDTSGCNDASLCGFSWPLGDKQVKSNSPACIFRTWAGSYHCGDDYAIGGNPKVYAITSGTVVSVVNGCPRGSYGSSCGGGYGNQVIIDHGSIMNGKKVYSLSAHLLNGSIKVKKGDSVTAGQEIAKVGSSGSSTGDHLHFELNNVAGGATKSSQCSQSYCYKKQGGVYAVLKQLEEQANEGCELGGNSDIISWGKEFIGKPYCHKYWDGNKPLSCTDCSGFTQGVYLHVKKIKLGGAPRHQCTGSKTYQVAGKNSTKGAQPGDIICFWGYCKRHKRVEWKHVGLYIDENHMLHETSKTGVKIVNLKNYKWDKIVRVK